MSKTTEEFFAKYEATRLLKSNLEANIDAMTDLTDGDKEALMRVNLIVIRQCLEDFGTE